MSDRLGEYLAERGLKQYQQTLEENDIDLEILGDLSDTDLKELGITSLGHRRKLLAAVTRPPVPAEAQPAAPAAPAEPAPQASKSEEVIYSKNGIEVWLPDFSGTTWADVRITNRRVILGSKTYALQNVDVVSVGDNRDAAIFVHQKQMSDYYTLTFFMSLLIIAPIVFAYIFPSKAEWLWCLPPIAGLLVLYFNKKPELEVSYSVRIGSSAEGDVFFTKDPYDAKEVVDALNKAIISLRM